MAIVDQLTANGLEVKDYETILAELELELQDIYGADINIEQNSPDGQLIAVFTKAATDYREQLTSIYNSFDPDSAIGIVLNSRCRINNIEREGGTFTIQPIQIITSATVNLDGLDDNFNDVNGTGYTIQDNQGNQFILIDSVTLTAGTNTKNFRAKAIGLVETTLGTINIQSTVILGVTSVDNIIGATTIGTNEETDAQLRIRRSQSVSINASGYLNGLTAKLLALDGVTEAVVFENVTSIIDADGIPAHSIWSIVEGGVTDDIGNIIYENKSAGCGMKGAQEVYITTPSGEIFTAKFDRATSENLHIKFDLKQTVLGFSFDQPSIKTYINSNLSYNIGEAAYTTNITQIAQEGVDSLGGGGVVLNMEISDDGITWIDYLETSSKVHQFTTDISNMTITEI